MKSAVLDASVAAKWFLPPDGEDLVAEALNLYGAFGANRIDLVVPDIFWPEFGNIAWKAVRRQRWSIASATSALESIRELQFTTFPSKPLLEPAFAIAAASGASVYDSLYVALADDSGRELITADERLVNALGSRFPVRRLSSLSIT